MPPIQIALSEDDAQRLFEMFAIDTADLVSAKKAVSILINREWEEFRERYRMTDEEFAALGGGHMVWP